MNEKKSKHLIVALSGIGLCIAGPAITNWHLAIEGNIIELPFTIAGMVITVAGILCCVGAILCQSGRYDK